MQGLVTTTKGTTYVFRDDHALDPCVWAWDIHDMDGGDRVMTHKWKRIPVGAFVVEFDIDDPPATVSYVPIMS